MLHVPQGAPFDERGGRLRGVFDLLAGHYPPFLFGLPVGNIVPIFHFHETTVDELEPALAYLKDNGYRTVKADAVARFIRDGVHPGPRTVVLTFDDAWASLWLVAGPLLEKYDMCAVAYAIPSRINDAAGTRPTIKDAAVDVAAADRSAEPFVTWPELRALSTSGRIDVQSHTWSHSMIFSEPRAIGVVDPSYVDEDFLNRPRIWGHAGPEFMDVSRLGYPLFPRRSRMSAAREFIPDADACQRLETCVSARGGAQFFEEADWQAALAPQLSAITGRIETDTERDQAIEEELLKARTALETRIGEPVRHLCLPWGVTSPSTYAALSRLGFATAVANRLSGRMAATRGTDPFFIKRLHSRHLFALPGRGRKVFTTLT